MNWTKNSFTFLVSSFLTLLLLELVLRMLPVLEVSRVKPLGSDSRAFNVSTVANSELVNSYEWDFKNVVNRKTNNLGFFSDFDYEAGFEGTVVIGDSFVEARQVSFDKTFHQLLSTQLDEPVYNIALAGAPLSQYHAYTVEVCDRYNPTKLIFSIIANDFDESWYSTQLRAGFFHYHDNGDLKPTPYIINFLRKAANQSSMVRYLYFNLSLGSLLVKSKQDENSDSMIEETSEALLEQREVTDLFLNYMLEQCVPPSKITFIIDANRYESRENSIYSTNPIDLPRMDYFAGAAEAMGFNVLKMQEKMIAAYKKDLEQFEFTFDYHWNELGHEIVAESLLQMSGNGKL